MIKAIIFDMDGTILNTLIDIRNAVNYALKIKGLKEKTEDEIKNAVGNGAYKLIERVVPKSYHNDLTKEVFDLYQSYYDLHSNDHTGPYEGILDLLKVLKKQGYKLGVVSNKFEHLVELLNHETFSGLFDVTVGEVKGIPIKPAPDMIYKALDLLDVTRTEALFVGDSEVDMLTATHAKIKSVGVTWGFRNRELLIEYDANYIIELPNELFHVLEKENTL